MHFPQKMLCFDLQQVLDEAIFFCGVGIYIRILCLSFLPLYDDRKEFGLDSFISPTLLSNMREKDLRKAISYHLKKIQSLLEPRQKV